jgi:tryptophanyl-tRNA synthetase
MKKQTIFSGIQPTGNLHIGNYIGAIKQWVNLQESQKELENELIFCIVDLHAITIYQDPKVLREKNLEVAALYIACGIDPKRSNIFIQSENHNHAYLTWIFDCVIPYGWMGRMTQFKDKSDKQKESTTVGLFNYPALMAADILLYDTDLVPVGKDQTQHVELARDVAEKFNRLYGMPVFKIPRLKIVKEAARIMSLQNPIAKMSKSEKGPMGTINLLDSSDKINEKVKRAVTDSGTEIVYREDKPAISNLLIIYSELSGKTVAELEEKYKRATYTQFKEDLAQVVDVALKPIREAYFKLRKEQERLNKILDEGRDFAVNKSSQTVKKVKEVMGLGR